MTPRQIMRIELTPSAKKDLATLSEKNGMTQVAAMSRLAEWFAGEHELLQAAVIGRIPAEIEVEVAKMILKRLASDDRKVSSR